MLITAMTMDEVKAKALSVMDTHKSKSASALMQRLEIPIWYHLKSGGSFNNSVIFRKACDQLVSEGKVSKTKVGFYRRTCSQRRNSDL